MHTCTQAHKHKPTRTHAHMHTCTHAHMHTCTHIKACVYVSVHVYELHSRRAVICWAAHDVARKLLALFVLNDPIENVDTA